MTVSSAFNDYQPLIDEDPKVVALARARREIFKKALLAEPDVLEVWSSGSLRRSTQLKPIHDLDLVVVFAQDHHPTWGQPGPSAEEALEHTRKRVKALLGDPGGSVQALVRLAKPRNHAVKCFVDPSDEGFTVDVMPALRPDPAPSTIWIPERNSTDWVEANPEYLINEVQRRHDAWEHYRSMVRVLKHWRRDVERTIGTDIKSLVIEVLALTCLPTSTTRPKALATFFEKAASALSAQVVDPAGLCGEIQSDLDYTGFQDACDKAAGIAQQALVCEANDDHPNAQRLWRDIFGSDFPAPAGPVSIGGAAAAAGATLPYQPVKDSPQG